MDETANAFNILWVRPSSSVAKRWQRSCARPECSGPAASIIQRHWAKASSHSWSGDIWVDAQRTRFDLGRHFAVFLSELGSGSGIQRFWHWARLCSLMVSTGFCGGAITFSHRRRVSKGVRRVVCHISPRTPVSQGKRGRSVVKAGPGRSCIMRSAFHVADPGRKGSLQGGFINDHYGAGAYESLKRVTLSCNLRVNTLFSARSLVRMLRKLPRPCV